MRERHVTGREMVEGGRGDWIECGDGGGRASEGAAGGQTDLVWLKSPFSYKRTQ